MNSGTIIRKGKLLNKVIFIAVAAVVLIAGIITAVSSVKFSNKVNSAIEEELMVACVHFSGEMNNVWRRSAKRRSLR